MKSLWVCVALLVSGAAAAQVEGGEARPPQEAHVGSESAPAAPEAPIVDVTPTTTDSASGALAFADHLFRDGDWYRAITEYRRYLFLVRGRDASAPRAAMAIGEALLRGEQWDAAGRQLDGVAQRAGDPTLRRSALFAAGRAYLLDGRPELAKPRFRVLVEDRDTDAKLRNEATWLLAWGHFDAGELEAAQGWFQKIVDDKAVHADDAKGVVTALRARADLEQKDPLLAGLLSLVPGLGHVYLGQWGTGLTSAGYNALFLVGAISAFVTGQWGVGLVLAAFELGWYGGGVFGAVAGAYRTNRDVVRNWRDDVLADHGATRELPEMRTVEPFLPGSLSRFTNLGDTPATPTVAPAPAGP